MKPNFAPSHIERWDSKLFCGYKQSMIRDVEVNSCCQCDSYV